MPQMPARVKFIKRRGRDSLFHNISNNLPRIKHFADNDYAMTQAISQQCSESKHQSWSWVHRGHLPGGACSWGSHVKMQKTSLSESLRLGWGHGTRGKEKWGVGGPDCQRIRPLMWCDYRAGALQEGWEVKEDKFVTWRLQQYRSIQASRTDWQEENSIRTEKADKFIQSCPSFL